CPGVGEKTAVKLIKEFGSVENMLEKSETIKGALGKKITENAEQIKFSKFLATIKTDVPVEVKIDELIRKPENINELRKLFTELEFKTFLTRLGGGEPVKETSNQPMTDSLFDFDDMVVDESVEATGNPLENLSVTAVETPDEIGKLVVEAAKHNDVAIEIYSIGEQAMTAQFVGMAICFDASKASYFQLPDEQSKRNEICEILQPLFSSEKTTIVSNDIKRDMILLCRKNIKFDSRYFDTSVAHYLLQPEMRHSLRQIAQTVLPGFNDMEWYSGKPYTAIDASPEMIALEIGRRAATNLLIKPILKTKIDEQQLSSLLTDIELPFIKVLASMEWEGARIDVNELHQLSEQLTARLNDLEEEAYKLAGQRFNISSPAQVGTILFDVLKIYGGA
ncbi:MAG: hypothetical protein K2G74_04480, partial [Muribaculaceae bacterium]|nr:hypothetical protein [Muribaculaceae bacterium]